MRKSKNERSRRQTILVANHDPAVLSIIRAILLAEGYRVLLATAAEGVLRLARLKNLRIDLALIEPGMAESRGGELAPWLTAVRPHLPVRLMSGFVDDQVIRMRMPELPGLDVSDSPFERAFGAGRTQ